MKLEELAKLINPQSFSEYPSGENKTEIGEVDIEKLRGREELDSMKVANKLKWEELESRKQDREQRKRYANYIFGFLCAYMVLVFIVLILSGFCDIRFCLSDSVIIALITTTTTANIIGIFIFVVKYLFKSSEDKK